jgi:hypothetical protein
VSPAEHLERARRAEREGAPLMTVRGPDMDRDERAKLLAELGEVSTFVLPASAEITFLPRVRLMRGQVVVRELDAPASARLWTPTPGARQTTTHRGLVLGIGPHPAPGASHGFEVGDVVQFHFGAVGTAKARTRAWTDGVEATWLTWEEVDAVWEAENACRASAPLDFGPNATAPCDLPSGHEGPHEIACVRFDGRGHGKLGAVWTNE